MEEIEQLLSTISNYVWGYPAIVLLLGTHIFLTIRLRFIQRYITTAIRFSLARPQSEPGEISHFASLMTALAATVGTGNIIGVATAISAGGPGAVFWMWLTGVFGFATKYSEAVLSIKFRDKNEFGEFVGGPMYVLEKGLNSKILAVLFALFTVIASFGIGNMVQSNAMSQTIENTFRLPSVITGIITAFLTALVILGGIKSIACVCEMLVPFMVVFYLFGCIGILIINYHHLPESLLLIFKSAFTGQSAIGGFLGAGVREAVRFGVARGLFSNEAGLGSAPIVAAVAKTKHPVQQALVSATGTFWDTVVICFITGLTLVSSGAWSKSSSPIEIANIAWSSYPIFGPIVLTIALISFVYSTILGWSYYGEKAWEYLFKTKRIFIYRWMWVIAVFIGANLKLNIVWTLADIANALMALPNLISIVFLTPLIIHETQDFLKHK
ncbi:MAG: sodium:alanine symporter family protein [Candidatus Hydrogenedens sp.]|nr:sodium:alanine symporter family protein [Candidatus Hydrogenedens sp.]